MLDQHFWPFGEQRSPVVDPEPIKFTGYERDLDPAISDADLDYSHARYHRPSLGRFLSVDPVHGHQSAPQSWNRYSYSRDNPLKYTDPTGREARLQIDEENRQITVTAEIDIWGEEATDEVAAEIESSIESAWNGHSYVDSETGVNYSLSVDVTVTNVGPRKKDASAPNRIRIDSSVDRDWVNRFGRVDTGAWKAVPDHPIVRAHEFGHLLGLPDDYTGSGLPNEGHAGHLMAGGAPYSQWRIAPHEVRDVVGGPVATYNRSGRKSFRVR